MREIETEDVRADERSRLPNVLSQDLGESLVQEVTA